MDIILLKNIDKVGGKYEVISVKPGYARNYLFPKKMALIANESNMKRLSEHKKQEDAAQSKILGSFEDIAKKLQGKTLKIGAKAGTTGKIFGSVTNIQLSNAIQDQLGIVIDRKKITVPEEATILGTFTASVELHKDVVTTIDFEVIQD